MPTSPKTAKEILEKFEKNYGDIGIVHELEYKEETEYGCDELISDSVKAFLLSAMRAAVEAVLDPNQYLKSCGCGHVLDANVKRFFNDDPTSPPTPKPE